MKCGNGHLSTKLLYDNEAIDRRRAQTLPENAYFEKLKPISSSQDTKASEESVEEELNEREDDVIKSEEEIPKYES